MSPNNSVDKILSISAIVIALTSVCISIWSGMETRKHNRLSVKPQLEICLSTTKTDFGYVVVNNGLGPAILTARKILIDGAEMQENGFTGFDNFLLKLDLHQNRNLSIGTTSPGKILRAGESENIIKLEILQSDVLEQLLPTIYKRVKIEISYVSMYHESFKCKIPSKAE
ncbi:hypothetical protein L0128_10070 [candidate division KSB1 bacterium]|nr:hypothetical protein [candidate division KSB1 bacterium]